MLRESDLPEDAVGLRIGLGVCAYRLLGESCPSVVLFCVDRGPSIVDEPRDVPIAGGACDCAGQCAVPTGGCSVLAPTSGGGRRAPAAARAQEGSAYPGSHAPVSPR